MQVRIFIPTSPHKLESFLFAFLVTFLSVVRNGKTRTSLDLYVVAIFALEQKAVLRVEWGNERERKKAMKTISAYEGTPQNLRSRASRLKLGLKVQLECMALYQLILYSNMFPFNEA